MIKRIIKLALMAVAGLLALVSISALLIGAEHQLSEEGSYLAAFSILNALVFTIISTTIFFRDGQAAQLVREDKEDR